MRIIGFVLLGKHVIENWKRDDWIDKDLEVDVASLYMFSRESFFQIKVFISDLVEIYLPRLSGRANTFHDNKTRILFSFHLLPFLHLEVLKILWDSGKRKSKSCL